MLNYKFIYVFSNFFFYLTNGCCFFFFFLHILLISSLVSTHEFTADFFALKCSDVEFT